MSLDTCLGPLLDEGKIDQETHDQARTLFAELQQDLRRQFGDQAADAMASDATLQALDRAASRKRFLAGKTIATRQRIELDLGGYDGGKGGGRGDAGGPIDPRGGPALFDGDGKAPFANLEGRRKAIRGRAHAMIDGILAEHSSNILGQVRHKAELDMLGDELFGGDSGNANAREFSDAWAKSAEMLRQRGNAAGMDVGRLPTRPDGKARVYVPQNHDPRKVRAVDYDEWRDFFLPLLDRTAMIDRRTGMPIGDGALELEMTGDFDAIRSDGWSNRTPGGQGAAALANRHGEARFYVFKDYAGWKTYNERFGSGTLFDAMTGHIDARSRDIAQLEVLGPNPPATVAWVKDTLTKSAQLDRAANSTAVDRAHAATKQIDRLYNEFTGATQRPENRNLALAFSAYRSFTVARKFGGAALSAVSDLGFQTSTRLYNGLSATSTLGDYLKTFKPGSQADQRLAVRLGLIAEEWSNRTAAQHRMLGEELTGEVSRRMAEGVLRASGLQRWTQSGRWAFGMEFLGHLTDESVKRFDALDPAFRRTLQRYGFTGASWDVLRKTPLEVDRGVPWIKPQNVEDQALGDRLLEMIHRETDFAVPVPDLKTRALISSVAPRGTLHGEIIKSAFLGKSFGISLLLMHGGRAMEMAGPKAARYAAGLVIGTTLMGALSIALKDLAAGRDPREMKSPEFWGAATIQGGGFGIFGDFLRSSQSRFGGGIAQTAMGPVADDVQMMANVASSKNHSGALFKMLKSQIPGGNLWYTRLAFDRLVADQLQELMDPMYRQSWKTMERSAREQGTGFWWAPGETAPSRAPDLSNALKELEP